METFLTKDGTNIIMSKNHSNDVRSESSESSDASNVIVLAEHDVLLAASEHDDADVDDDKWYDTSNNVASMEMHIEGVEHTVDGRTSVSILRKNLSWSKTLHDEKWYGQPISAELAMQIFPSKTAKENTSESTTTRNPQGLIWKADVIPNQWWSETSSRKSVLLSGLRERDFHITTRQILPCRGTLPLTHDNLLSSLTQTPDGRYIFHGRWNGWPQLNLLELVTIERKRTLIPFGKSQYATHWTPSKGKLELEEGIIYRATIAGPWWTSIGWSESSPGFVFWFESTIPRFTYGTNLIRILSADAKVSHVHMISHRYAIPKETTRDLLTYHSIVLLEWDHEEYCTVVEGAYLNGIGGYKCRSNWYDDRDSPHNLLSQYMPQELIGPWRTSAGEIRCFDVPQRNLDQFVEYLQQYRGKDARFVDPQVTFSHVARLSFRSKRDIGQYLLNYVGRDCSYQELRKNCQTLAADLCAFLAGKKYVDPFHPLVQIEYRNRAYQFLYESNMYAKSKTKK
jgi:hypothetical protein